MWIILRHDSAAVGAGHNGKTAADEFERRRARGARAAAQPEHRPPGPAHEIGQSVDQRRIGRQRHDRAERDVPRRGRFFPLYVDGNFEGDRPARRAQRGAGSCHQHAHSGARLPHAETGFGHRAQHVGLPRNVVDRGAIAIHVRTINLRGDVQHWGPGGQRLELRARRISCRAAGAGDHDAKRARHACVGVCHIHGAGFPARRDEADAIVPCDRIENRHVVDRDHPEGGRDADLGESVGDQIADRLGERSESRRAGGESHPVGPTCAAMCRRKSRVARR